VTVTFVSVKLTRFNDEVLPCTILLKQYTLCPRRTTLTVTSVDDL